MFLVVLVVFIVQNKNSKKEKPTSIKIKNRYAVNSRDKMQVSKDTHNYFDDLSFYYFIYTSQWFITRQENK